MASNIDARVRACVDDFVEQLTVLIRESALESVQEALGGAMTARRKPGRPPGSPTTRATTRRKRAAKRGGRRTASDVEATQAEVLAYVRGNSQSSVTDIASSMGVSTKELQLPMRKLVEEGKLKTTGQRRGTRYDIGSGRAPRNSAKKAVRRKSAKKKVSRKKAAGRRKKTA